MADERAGRADLPTGTVTFLRTDVEGSMALARTLGARWDELNDAHLGLIKRAVEGHGGVCVKTEGDAVFGVFPEAGAAVAAAIEAQVGLSGYPWPADGTVRVRMGLHTGEAHLAGDDYGGFDVNRAARIAAVGHGGQIVLSEPTRLLADAALVDGVLVRDLGRHVLRGVPAPEHLFQLDIPGLRTAFPPLKTSTPTAGNLPARMTSFLGRDADLAELRALLATNRLVTLTGPGGIGKTSLGVELARSMVDEVPDGVWFVGLDEIHDASIVLATIARALGLYDGPERPATDSLRPYLADRTALLVIDNFEQVMEASGDIASMLRMSPGSRIIVTSRSPLRIAGEQEYPVRPLVAGTQACSALFSQRARAVRPGWDPGSDASVVDDICGLLDGLPLGLELAAARVSLLPVRAIRDRLAARLPLPGSGPRNAPDRQRTLDGAIAWSHELLDDDARRTLQVLAVFEGSFDIEQAEAVSGGDVFDGLASLVDQSLVARDSTDHGVRFRLLQTIRSFALDRLVASGRATETRAAHAAAYLALVENAATHYLSADQRAWLDRLAADHSNLRAATRWAIDNGDVEKALRFVAASWRYWLFTGHLAEGAELTDAALALRGADARTPARMGAIAAAGGIGYWRRDEQGATACYEEQRELAIELGDRAAEADALFNLVFARGMHLDSERALRTALEARDLFAAIGDARGVARIGWVQGTIAFIAGQPSEALPIFEDALSTFERVEDPFYHSMAVGSISWCQFALGNRRTACRWMIQSLEENQALGDMATCTLSLSESALVAIEVGDSESAGMLLGAFENLCEKYAVRPPVGLQFLMTGGQMSQQVEAALGPERLADAMERGRRLTLDEAIELVQRLGEAL